MLFLKKYLNPGVVKDIPCRNGFRFVGFWIFISGLAFSSCNVINPPEPLPAYLHITPFDFHSNESSQGSSSNKIEDAWVYVDGKLQGVYELSATFPVIESGTHKVSILPGIYFNGIKSQRYPYPFYAAFDTTINMKEGFDCFINPRSTYIAGLNITNENFDSNGGIIFDTTTNSQAELLITQDAAEVFEGNGSGKAVLDTSQATLEITSGSLILPVIGNQRTFVEMNYKTSLTLQVGIYATGPNYVTDQRLTIIYLKPNSVWNKLYLEITNPLHYYSDAASFKLFFYSQIPDLNSSGKVYLDNVKIINN